jgi:hypothetical protein
MIFCYSSLLIQTKSQINFKGNNLKISYKKEQTIHNLTHVQHRKEKYASKIISESLTVWGLE